MDVRKVMAAMACWCVARLGRAAMAGGLCVGDGWWIGQCRCRCRFNADLMHLSAAMREWPDRAPRREAWRQAPTPRGRTGLSKHLVLCQGHQSLAPSLRRDAQSRPQAPSEPHSGLYKGGDHGSCSG